MWISTRDPTGIHVWQVLSSSEVFTSTHGHVKPYYNHVCPRLTAIVSTVQSLKAVRMVLWMRASVALSTFDVA